MKIKSLVLLFLSIAFTNYTNAQTSDQILDKYFEAVGGKDAWSKITSIKSTGKVKAQGMEFPMVMLQKNMKNKMEMTFQGMSIVQPAFDGTTGWQTNFMTMKAEKMESEENEIAKQSAGDFPDALLNYNAKGYTFELLGSEMVDGTDCHKLKLTKKPLMIDGKSEENADIYFFDKESNVPIKISSVIKTGPMKGKMTDALMSDYQEVGGIMIPFTLNQMFDGQLQAAISMEKIELNVPIDDKLFSFPEDK